MKKTPSVHVSFSKYTDADLETVCNAIMQSMTENSNFLTPVPVLAEIKTVLEDYSGAKAEAASRDRNKVAAKNTVRYQLVQMMGQLGRYVNTIADGDLEKLISSGLVVSKMPAPRYVGIPQNLQVIPAGTGKLKTQVKGDKNAISYKHEITADPLTEESVWTSVITSRSKFTFTKLEQGKKFWGRVIAIGSNDQSESSTEISQYTI